jgi:Protein of unknown function (DUF2442)
MKLHILTGVRPLDPRRGTLQLFFDDGSQPIVDLSALLAQGGVFEALRDPNVFSAAQIEPDGRTLFWQIDEDIVDLCADALWLLAQPGDRAAAQ